MPLAGVNAETVLTFAWDITWYQYRVSPEAAQPVRIAERGHDIDEVEATLRALERALRRDGPARAGARDRLSGAGLRPVPRIAPMATRDRQRAAATLLERLGVDPSRVADGDLVVRTPITGEEIGRVARHRRDRRRTPPSRAPSPRSRRGATCRRPRRGELVRLLGEELRREKEALGALVTLEVGKIAQEGLGEVQEMIDICDFAVGLSRQLYGRSIASERPGHRLTETWHPLGPVAVISAFNFPVAVWSWNAALALVCGDPVHLEAVRADAAHGARDHVAARAGRRAVRRRAPTGSSSS